MLNHNFKPSRSGEQINQAKLHKEDQNHSVMIMSKQKLVLLDTLLSEAEFPWFWIAS